MFSVPEASPRQNALKVRLAIRRSRRDERPGACQRAGVEERRLGWAWGDRCAPGQLRAAADRHGASVSDQPARRSRCADFAFGYFVNTLSRA